MPRLYLILLLCVALAACRFHKTKEPILTPPSEDPAPSPKATPGFAAAFSPDATYALLLQNGALTQYTLSEEPSPQALSVPGIEDAQALAISARAWAAGFATGEIKLFSRPDSTPIVTIQPNKNPIAVLAISPDDQRIAVGYNNGDVALIDLSQQKTLPQNPRDAHKDRVTALSFSPDSQLLLSASSDRRLKLWSRSGELLNTMTGHSRGVWSAVIADPTNAVSSSEDGAVRGWALPGGQESFFRLGSATSIAIADTNKAQIVAAQNNAVLLIEASSGVELVRLNSTIPPLLKAAYNETSRTLWAFTTNGELARWTLPPI